LLTVCDIEQYLDCSK